MKIIIVYSLSSFLNLNEFWMSSFLLLNIKVILKKVGNQTAAGPQWLPYFFFPTIKVSGDSNCLVTHILQNILFCVQDKKEINLVQHASE